MRFLSCFLAALAALALLAGNGRADNKIPDKVQSALENAALFELFSLDPAGKIEDPRDDFHGWKILGKYIVSDAVERKKLADSLTKGAADVRGAAPKCFTPRHGLRVIFEGKVYDVVLSFECLQAEVYVGDKKGDGFMVTKAPWALFDALLREHKVEVAEVPKKEESLPGFPNVTYNDDFLTVYGRADKPLLKPLKVEYDKNKKEISWLIEVQGDITYEDYLTILNTWRNDYNPGAKGPTAHFFGKDHVKLFERDLREVGQLRDARRHDCIRLILDVGDGFDDATTMEIRRP